MRLPPNSPVPPADDPAGRAFTLIELLVVVSIIAIIAAMLLPALGQARRTVREQVCGNSFRTWGQGVNLYAADYDQWLPKIDMTCLPGAMLDNLAPEFVRTMPSYVPLEMWYCPYGTLKTPGPDIKTIDIPSWLVKYCWDLAGPCGGRSNWVVGVSNPPMHNVWIPRAGGWGAGTVTFPDPDPANCLLPLPWETEPWPGRPDEKVAEYKPILSDLAYLSYSLYPGIMATVTADMITGGHKGARSGQSVNTVFADGHVETRRVPDIRQRWSAPAQCSGKNWHSY